MKVKSHRFILRVDGASTEREAMRKALVGLASRAPDGVEFHLSRCRKPNQAASTRAVRSEVAQAVSVLDKLVWSSSPWTETDQCHIICDHCRNEDPKRVRHAPDCPWARARDFVDSKRRQAAS